VLAKLMTLGAMTGAAALLVSTSLPANAFFSAAAVEPAAVTTRSVEVQSLKVETGAVVSVPVRDAYTVVSLVQQIKIKYGTRSFSYTNDPLGTIQWPFPVAVPIASGFGDRQVANCGYCSTFHEGLDFTPGAGVAIQAIADGVVSLVKEDSGGLGIHVAIDHIINGQKVQSVYAHMLAGSVRVVVGQQVKVTDEVGQVGSTGASTGAHLHLEIHVDGVPIDPFVWLKANAN
jgi:murein DD-endopeptidase MepM/ murein hydrolase activator NlpD